MGKLNEDLLMKREILLKLIDHSEKKTTSHINELFEAKLKDQPMEMEEVRNKILSVKEKVMRRKFQNKDDLVVLKTLIAEIQYVLLEMKGIEPLLNPYDGSSKLSDLILSIQTSISITIECAGCKNKDQLLKAFKRHDANTFYKLVKGDKLDNGLPQNVKCEVNMLNGAPNEEKDRKTPFFAWWKEDIARSAVDFFSIGHILMGQCFFFIAYLLIWDGNGGGNGW